MTVSHILVPYDGSEESERAFDEALKIAKKYDSKISTLTCYWEMIYRLFGFVELSLNAKKLPEKFKKLNAKASKEKIMHNHYLIESDTIVSIIQSFALEHNVDMIIMGSKNRQGFNKMYNGDLSEEVNRCAHCIVKVVK